MAGLNNIPRQNNAGLTVPPSGFDRPMAQLGDLEYLAELAASGSQDELSRLGTKVAGGGLFYNPAYESKASYYRPDIGVEPQQRFKAMEGQFPTLGTVYTGTGASVPAVQSHEFRHAGARHILGNFTRDQMVDKWGEEGGQIHDILKYKGEGAMEVFDRPQDPAGSLGTMAATLEASMKPEWTDVLKRRMGGIATDIMTGLGVPPRAGGR